ncbi:MAG: hypothetical protein U5N10_06100 [Gemmobacter sp.]|nr:hypothetical protein [Gemmobacter sp.]
MGQRDDLGHALGRQASTTGLQRLSISSVKIDRIGPGSTVSGVSVARADTMPIFSPPTSSTTWLLDSVRQTGLPGDSRCSPDQDRELHLVEESGQPVRPVVEFVVAHGHGIKADLGHELCLNHLPL